VHQTWIESSALCCEDSTKQEWGKPLYVGLIFGGIFTNLTTNQMTELITDHQSEVQELCGRYHIRSLALFGSRLHGDDSKSSDMDVLVEFEEGHTPGFGFAEIQRALAEIFGIPIDLHTRQSLSPYFREQVVKEAQIIYGDS
jgi:hypothetical protein